MCIVLHSDCHTQRWRCSKLKLKLKLKLKCNKQRSSEGVTNHANAAAAYYVLQQAVGTTVQWLANIVIHQILVFRTRLLLAMDRGRSDISCTMSPSSTVSVRSSQQYTAVYMQC